MITKRKSVLGVAVVSALIVAICAVGFSQQRGRSSPALNEDAIRARIKFLSSDLLEGRGTGARGGEIAASYIAAQMEALGLKGAGANGSFFQPVSLVGVKADPNTKLTVSGRNGKESFRFADEYVAFTGSQTEDVDVDADMVFVGYGIDAPEQRWNDYKGGPEDYRGKILVMLVNDPPATTEEPNLFVAKALTPPPTRPTPSGKEDRHGTTSSRQRGLHHRSRPRAGTAARFARL